MQCTVRRLQASPTLKLAIVGSGPSAFYAAARVLSSHEQAEVHMYERLPTPNGLVRWGVAPDHPDVKNVEHRFAEVAQDPRFRFFGNVNVVASTASTSSSQASPASSNAYPLATQLPFSSLRRHYAATLLSYGSSLARPLGIPGSAPGELTGVDSALDFVNWYNGHPIAHDEEQLALAPWRRVDLSSTRHLSVVGAGNVALDVARIVLRANEAFSPSAPSTSTAVKGLAALRTSDMPECVLAHLAAACVERVDIFARRGAAQLACTNKELREMLTLKSIAFEPVAAMAMQRAREDLGKLEAAAAENPDEAGEARVRKRLLGLLEKGGAVKAGTQQGLPEWSFNLFHTPKELLPSEKASTRLGSARWTLTGPAKEEAQVDEKEVKTDMLISSVGYMGAPLDGAQGVSAGEGEIPWDAKRGVVPNEGGRVRGAQGIMPGMYVSGWLARGPVGVIASTMYDANSVADLLVSDWLASLAASSNSSITSVPATAQVGEALLPTSPPAPGAPEEVEKSSKPVVSWDGWRRLDAEELRRGAKLGKLREKILSVREMLSVIEG